MQTNSKANKNVKAVFAQGTPKAMAAKIEQVKTVQTGKGLTPGKAPKYPLTPAMKASVKRHQR